MKTILTILEQAGLTPIQAIKLQNQIKVLGVNNAVQKTNLPIQVRLDLVEAHNSVLNKPYPDRPVIKSSILTKQCHQCGKLGYRVRSNICDHCYITNKRIVKRESTEI